MTDCPNCEYHRQRAQRWREEAYTLSGHPLPDCDEPWSPVSIGVDMTEAGAHVVGIYAMSDETSQIFYAKHHPAPQRTWVGLIDEEAIELAIKVIARLDLPPEIKMQLQQQFIGALHDPNSLWMLFAAEIEAKLKEKNT